MTTPDDLLPRDLLRQYPPLEEALRSLADLMYVNRSRWVAEEIVALAMVMGIHAAEAGRQRLRYSIPPPPDITR